MAFVTVTQPHGAQAETDAAVEAALSTIDPALLQGKTQDQIKSELPISMSYRDETSPISEDVEVDVGGQTVTATIYR